jgi:hypothetical protein
MRQIWVGIRRKCNGLHVDGGEGAASRQTLKALCLGLSLVRRRTSLGATPTSRAKRAPHGIRAPEAAGHRDLFEAAIRPLQLLASGFDSRRQHVLGWRPAHLAREDAFKVPDAHGDAIGKDLGRQSPSQILHDPELKLLDGLHLGRLRG